VDGPERHHAGPHVFHPIHTPRARAKRLRATADSHILFPPVAHGSQRRPAQSAGPGISAHVIRRRTPPVAGADPAQFPRRPELHFLNPSCSARALVSTCRATRIPTMRIGRRYGRIWATESRTAQRNSCPTVRSKPAVHTCLSI